MQNCQIANHFPKWLALLANHQQKYVNSQNHTQTCYEVVLWYDSVSLMANSNGKCIM